MQISCFFSPVSWHGTSIPFLHPFFSTTFTLDYSLPFSNYWHSICFFCTNMPQWKCAFCNTKNRYFSRQHSSTDNFRNVPEEWFVWVLSLGCRCKCSKISTQFCPSKIDSRGKYRKLVNGKGDCFAGKILMKIQFCCWAFDSNVLRCDGATGLRTIYFSAYLMVELIVQLS